MPCVLLLVAMIDCLIACPRVTRLLWVLSTAERGIVCLARLALVSCFVIPCMVEERAAFVEVAALGLNALDGAEDVEDGVPSTVEVCCW